MTRDEVSVRDVSALLSDDASSDRLSQEHVAALMPMVRRIVWRAWWQPPFRGRPGAGAWSRFWPRCPGSSRDARAVRHRHRAQRRGLDVAGRRTASGATGTGSSTSGRPSGRTSELLAAEEQRRDHRAPWPADWSGSATPCSPTRWPVRTPARWPRSWLHRRARWPRS